MTHNIKPRTETTKPDHAATAAIAGHQVHAALVPVPIVCFGLVLVTDILYWQTAHLLWSDFSSWLLLAGLVGAGLAAIAGLIDLLVRRALRKRGIAWVHGLGNLAVMVLAFFNALVHARDGWTAVVPTGMILSVLTVLIMLVTVWLGREMAHRHEIGVRSDD